MDSHDDDSVSEMIQSFTNGANGGKGLISVSESCDSVGKLHSLNFLTRRSDLLKMASKTSAAWPFYTEFMHLWTCYFDQFEKGTDP